MTPKQRLTPEGAKTLRQSLNLTQEQIGSMAGYSSPAVRWSEIERGVRNLPEWRLRQIKDNVKVCVLSEKGRDDLLERLSKL